MSQNSDVRSRFEGGTFTVRSPEQLLHAVSDLNIRVITIEGFLNDLPSIRLSPSQQIRGTSAAQSGLSFRDGSDGIQVSRDNSVSSLTIVAEASRCAIWNDESVEDLGILRLEHLETIGRVRILARDKVRAGHVEVQDVDIIAADSRAATERPNAFGVFVLQGAFTLWNLQADSSSRITAEVAGISIGRHNAPVLGSGVFVGGYGAQGGSLHLQRLETGPIYVDGRIKPGTPDQITGGVFVVHGAEADLVNCLGPVSTFGPNDMALDNWGSVDRWYAAEKVTTYGPSGIGFVNFGRTREIQLAAPIETFGQGARGFNVYAGWVDRAEFARIVTHGDGAVGVQISRPIGDLVVKYGIETFGGTGPSLVKGVVQELSAVGLSIKPGGSAERVSIRGGLKTHGDGVVPLEQQGTVQSLAIEGGFFQSAPRS